MNSLDEMANEENRMTELEENFYLVGQKEKRYFGREDVLFFFKDFEIGDIIAYDMKRYKKPKSVLEFAAIKQRQRQL